MKVSDASPAVVSAVTSRATQSADQKEVKDRVSVSNPQGEAAIRIAMTAMDPSRATRVAEVVSAVRSGQYYPSPTTMAQKLVSEAEVESQLRANLQ